MLKAGTLIDATLVRRRATRSTSAPPTARSTAASSSALPIPQRCQLWISISGLEGSQIVYIVIVYVAVDFRGLDEG